jgi:hypothetical protein
MAEHLGNVIHSQDSAMLAARAGQCAVGEPSAGDVELAVARRLTPEERTLKGIAMVPVAVGSDLIAMIELGRFDHPFRQIDVAVTRKIAAATLARLARLATLS